MKVYAISGLGADERVFQELNLNFELVCVQWIQPYKNESIQSYTKRLFGEESLKEPFGVVAVSFGGLIANELTKLIKPKFVVLISSIETKKELPVLYRIIGFLKLNKLVPKVFLKPPFFISKYVFSSKSILLKQIIRDTDTKFAKWAVNAFLNWNNLELIQNVYRIHGEKDRLLKAPQKSDNVTIIKNAGHFAIVDKSNLVSKKLNKIFNELN